MDKNGFPTLSHFNFGDFHPTTITIVSDNHIEEIGKMIDDPSVWTGFYEDRTPKNCNDEDKKYKIILHWVAKFKDGFLQVYPIIRNHTHGLFVRYWDGKPKYSEDCDGEIRYVNIDVFDN